MGNRANKAICSAVAALLKPVVRVLLRNGVSSGTFIEITKQVFVDVAEKEFAISGKKQSVSRVSVLTGLSRKEIQRIKCTDRDSSESPTEKYNRAARVISGWVRDCDFADRRGKPVALPMDGEGNTFSQLVRRFSGDVPARAILDELLRVGAVKRLKDGRIRLLVSAYVPHGDDEEKINILGTDMAHLATTIAHNLQSKPANVLFQRKVAYNNLPEKVLPKLRALTTAKGQAFLEEFDEWLSSRDRDVNPAVEGEGRFQAGIGIYYFEQPLKEGKEND